MNRKTQLVVLSVLAVLIVICLSLGVTRAFLFNAEVGETDTDVSFALCARVALTDNDTSININNAYPMTRARALTSTPYTFTVKNTCTDAYQINLYLGNLNTNTLTADKIHYIITYANTKVVVTEGMLSEVSDEIDSLTEKEKNEYDVGVGGSINHAYKINDLVLDASSELSYDLYLYVDEEVTDSMDKTFVVGLGAKAISPTTYKLDSNESLINEILEKNFEYSDNVLEYEILQEGNYLIEAWGASNADESELGNYAVGNIYLNQGDKLFITTGNTTESNKTKISLNENTDYNLVLSVGNKEEDRWLFIEDYFATKASEDATFEASWKIDKSYYLTDANIVDGLEEEFLAPTGESEAGHVGNGYVRVSFLGTN